jgi:hypothetical protein
MKPRSDPTMLRALAHVARLDGGLKSINREELVQQLEAAADDVETMAEDLTMARETMRAMAHDIALSNPPEALFGKREK